MRRISILILTLFFTVAIQAAPQSLSCKSKLIYVGDSAELVRKHCGKPTSVRTEERPVRSGNRVTGSYMVEIWRYDSRTQFPAVLEVEAGTVKVITFER
jgi:hypothetical protein